MVHVLGVCILERPLFSSLDMVDVGNDDGIKSPSAWCKSGADREFELFPQSSFRSQLLLAMLPPNVLSQAGEVQVSSLKQMSLPASCQVSKERDELIRKVFW